nr:hypothetical protein [Candidatus Sigynarchaeota archaeon]
MNLRRQNTRAKYIAIACCLGTIIANVVFGAVVFRPPPSATNLGTPVKSMTIWGTLLVNDSVTGRPVLYAGTHTAAGWGRLIRYDYTTNDTAYYDCVGSKGAYGLCEYGGKIYVGSIQAAAFFCYNPTTDQISYLGDAAGEDFVLTCHPGPDGRIYGATYPNAKVVVYNPANGQIQDLGRMHPTESYVRDLAVAENGKVFCGIGSKADIIVYDPLSGNKTSILPAQYKNNSFAYTMDTEDDVVYAYMLFDYSVLIFNATTNALLKEVKNASILRQISGGSVLVANLSGGYSRFNRSTHGLDPYTTPPYSLCDVDAGIGFSADSQAFAAYNVTTGLPMNTVDVSQDGEGMSIFSLGIGPDGCIYGGVYNLLHLFRYSPGTSSLSDLGTPIPGASGEFYSFLDFNGKLYMASYTYAILSVYDPAQPWNPGTSNTSNPRKIGPVGDEQYRPPALVAGSDGRVYIGSIPTYGKLGGALTAYDPVSDTFDVHRNIIPNQSVVSLTPSIDGSIIYGGSSIYGGYDLPGGPEAHFFAWNTTTNSTVLDIVPVVGCSAISALVTAPDGTIIGSAGDKLFVFDPVSWEIIHVESSTVGIIKQLVKCTNGHIIGISESFTFRMRLSPNPGDLIGFDYLYSGGTAVAIDNAGKIYMAVGTDLFLIDGVVA